MIVNMLYQIHTLCQAQLELTASKIFALRDLWNLSMRTVCHQDLLAVILVCQPYWNALLYEDGTI